MRKSCILLCEKKAVYAFMTALEQYLGGLSDKRVGVIGAGVSNMPLIRMLRAAGIRVTVHDKKDPTELGDSYATLATLGVDFVLGEHYLDALDEDVIFRTPGVHPRFLEKAQQNGSEITSEMELFFTVCPCPIIGITGSDGKTTTTTLVSEILKHAGYTVHLGGNIGTPLLPRVGEMQPEDLAVVELSSFQLMGMKHSPHVAAITNLTPNHLDYHKDFDEYVQAKTAIYRSQQEGDRLVLNLDDEVTRSLHAAGNLFCTSKTQELANGVFLKDGVIYIAENGARRELMPAADIRIPGAHNVYNMMMAAAVVQGYASDDDIRAVATTFGGVEHRIEFVRELDGVKYYNDSIASSPTRTIAGLESFQQKVILIAGGYDKHIPYDVLGEPICAHVKSLILTGATAPKIRDCVLAVEGEHPPVFEVADLETAVREAQAQAQPGDVVIMSPASASFDRFKKLHGARQAVQAAGPRALTRNTKPRPQRSGFFYVQNQFRKSLSFFEREGWRSLRSALASIWRIRSRVTLNSLPTSSSVRVWPSSMPKRRRSTFSSRGVSVLSTSTSCSLSSMNEAASAGSGASSSGMKSPRWESSSSPIGVSSETGSCAILRMSRTRSTGMFISGRSPPGWGRGPAPAAAGGTRG